MSKIQEFNPELLRMYYARLFPYNSMFKWLSYGHDPANDSAVVQKDFFSKREFSFTMQDDIYIRYLSFKDEGDMKSWIQKKQPHKIDLGAIFSHPPDQHTTVKATQFKPESRELVFDVDVTDYDLVKETIWNGTSMSQRIWPYMAACVKVINRSLREDFGFKHIFWVYSGRRGIHCWVCDKKARDLTNEARSAVVEHLSCEMGNENSGSKVYLSGTLHPMLQKAYDDLEPFFVPTIAAEEGQGLLCDPSKWEKVLEMIPHPGIREKLANQWAHKSDESDAAEKWEQIKTMVGSALEKSTKKRKTGEGSREELAGLSSCIRKIVFTHLYPRLDVNVSKARNHLLKSPWCVHPKTGRVCVPFNPDEADSFNPESVPSLATLAEEINAYDAKHAGDDKKLAVADFKKTSLKPIVDYFDKAFLRPMGATIRNEFRAQSEKVAAATGDW